MRFCCCIADDRGPEWLGAPASVAHGLRGDPSELRHRVLGGCLPASGGTASRSPHRERPGHKLRETYLPFSRPDLDGSELELIRESLDSGWITTGPLTRRFEHEFAAKVGARHAIGVNSCTAALHLALEAVGIGPDDEVITSPYTFASTAEVVRYFAARPRFVDIQADTLNIDPDAVAAAIGPRTRAIIPVHVGGHPAELDALDKLASDHGLALIEDAAHSLPAAYRGVATGARRPSLVGSPQLVCFSFYATKPMTTGEGGMICTDDEALAERCRSMALHGISKDAWNRYSESGSWYYEIIAPGFKYNLTDIASAMGLAQLSRLDQMRARRAEIAARYNDAFATLSALVLPSVKPWVTHSWHLYSLRIKPEELTIDRARFIEELKARNIGASVHFIPLHLHPYYRDKYGYEAEDFPIAYREYQREISLPIYSAMTDEDASDVVQAVADIVESFRVV
ncbi:MAG: DegT/DnrJ/EryC1/StrS family aminotransferase [Thermoleophilia bacterium]|nr:DegT/DnrJ/EryC1/StrS family aminotransferase [Thermoleophilia bacterium]